MTDTELMMLEQMTYIKDACKIAEVSASQVAGETIMDRLSVFDETALQKLEESGAEGQQWAAIIKYIKGNSNINTLVQGDTFKDDNGVVLATAYYYENNPDEGIVSFAGTSTGDCWFDNATGFGTADTEVQKKALAYIDSLSFDSIEVVGHSKGGNLAQYVTITSNKVSKCVSMDGQGFSQEFLEKYWAEIETKGSRITNYSLSTDFVHILLYPIPNAIQDYCTGDRVDNFAENHYANSFFQYKTTYDSDGNPVTVLDIDNNGCPVIINKQKENEMMTYLHQFTCFALSTMPFEERIEMGDYIGNILKLCFSKNPVTDAYGNVYSDPMKYIFSDEEKFCKLIAYVIKYMEHYNLTEKQVRELLSMLGLDGFMKKIDDFYDDNKILCDIALGGAESLLMLFLNNITDGKRDPIIESILDLFSLEDLGFDGSMKKVWANIEKEYKRIPEVKRGANQNINIREGRVYKYTADVYEMLRTSMNALKMMSLPDVSKWTKYQANSWFKTVFADLFIKGINEYNEKIKDIYTVGLSQVEETFTEIERLDYDCSIKIDEKISDINVLVLGTKE